MTTVASLATSSLDVAGLPLSYLDGGSGSPLLVLHHDTGRMGADAFPELLAADHRVVVPTLPGWDGTPRPEWMLSVRDMAVLQHLFLDQLGIDRIDIVGLGFGGWIAAEMATMNQSRFSHLVLVNAAGIKPDEGEILDQFLYGHEAWVQACYHDDSRYEAHYAEGRLSVEELVAIDENREMTARIAWKPYMYSQTLSTLLTEVRTPARLIWSEQGAVIPVSCARQYNAALPNSSLEILDDAGHFAEIEQPQALADSVRAFCSS